MLANGMVPAVLLPRQQLKLARRAEGKPLHMLHCTEVPQQTVIQGH
jgi:hypothetical protein